jgi:iron complex outermembrane receptor protein
MSFRESLLGGCASASVLIWALGGATAASAADATTAPSSAPSQEATQVSDLVVTGTNIRGVAPVGSTVTTLTPETLSAAGATTMVQLLEEAPQIFSLGVSEDSRGQPGGSSNITYGSSINLRGIGAYATLVLVDGHRVVPQGTSGQSVDPSSVPTIMLSRADIEADGASATYGSDAIAGVVNLILKRHVPGVEVNARYGGAPGYSEYVVGAVGGLEWSTGQFTVSYEHGFHSSLAANARSFTSSNLAPRGGGDFRVNTCNPGTLTIGPAGGTVTYALPAGGVTQATAGSLVAGTQNLCDNFASATLFPQQTRNSGAFTFDQDVGERVHLFADGIVSRRDFALTPAAIPATIVINNASPDFIIPPGGTLGQTSETVGYSFAGVYPNNQATGFSEEFNVTYGAAIKLFHGFSLTLQGGYGYDKDFAFSNRGLDSAALTAAVANGTFNPFQPGPSPSVVAGILNAVSDTPGSAALQVYDAKLDGPLFSLPGGDVRLALGYEAQIENADTGLFQGNPPANAAYTVVHRHFTRTVNSAYGEAFIPLVGPGNSMPLVRSLDIDVAGRWDSYNDIHASTINPKFGVNWSPVEGLTLKGTYGTSFRAPIFSQIYGNSSALFVANFQDPTCNCSIKGVSLSGGNLNLKPETATTYSAGVEWRPASLNGAKFSLSYFNINYRNQVIAVLGNLAILGQEQLYAGTGIITRNPTQAFLTSILCNGAPCAVNNGNLTGAQVFIDGRNQNLSATLAQGFDFEAFYPLVTDHGEFDFDLLGTVYTGFKTAVTASATPVNQLNTIYNPLAFKTRGSVTWKDGPFTAGLVLNYLSGYENTIPKTVQRVSSYTTLDLHAAYTLFKDDNRGWGKNLRLFVDVTNIGNTSPPFVNVAPNNNSGGGYDPTLVNPAGRVVSVGLDKTF